MVFVKEVMSSNELEALRIFRLLNSENQTNLLELVYLAYASENSVGKSLGFKDIIDGTFTMKPQDFS